MILKIYTMNHLLYIYIYYFASVSKYFFKIYYLTVDMRTVRTLQLIVVFLFGLEIVTSNAQKNIDLSIFNDKKIVTIIEASSQEKQIGDVDRSSKTRIVVGNTISKTQRKQELSIKLKENHTVVNFQITKIKIESNMGGIENNYDSDNPFERNEFATALGNQYDPYIKKVISLKCDKVGNIIDTLSKNVNLKKVESKAIPNLSKNKLWSSIFVNSPDNFVWKANNTWTDSLLIDETFTINQYEVQTIKANLATIKINGFSIPPKPSNIKFGTSQDGMSNDLITRYDGVLIVDIKNNFIAEINLNKQTESEIKLMNLSTKSLSEIKINLKNAVSK